MALLPTFDLTPAQTTRVLARFTGTVDAEGNPLTPQQAYKRWLKRMLVAEVRNFELQALQAQQDAARQQTFDSVTSALDINDLA